MNTTTTYKTVTFRKDPEPPVRYCPDHARKMIARGPRITYDTKTGGIKQYEYELHCPKPHWWSAKCRRAIIVEFNGDGTFKWEWEHTYFYY